MAANRPRGAAEWSATAPIDMSKRSLYLGPALPRVRRPGAVTRNTGQPGAQRPKLVGRYHEGYGEPDGRGLQGPWRRFLGVSKSYIPYSV